MLDVVYGHRDNFGNANDIESLVENCLEANINGTLYFGYPIISKQYDDEQMLVEALLVTEKHGVIAFTTSNLSSPDDIIAHQDDLYVLLETKLKSYSPLKKGRKLLPSITSITYSSVPSSFDEENYHVIHNCNDLENCLSNIDNVEDNSRSFKHINSVLESLVNLKPQKKRDIKKEGSLGWIIKEVEKQIANLDKYQKKAALEISNKPQRIRGLAGSGKTIVLALKAAYLHTAFPEKKICITFNTRSLKRQFIDLVRRFTFEHINDEPNWDNIHIIHAWGGQETGIYTTIAKQYDKIIYAFNEAKSKYGYSNAFNGICKELLDSIRYLDRKPIYDILLIDEAQDLPKSFFELSLKIVKNDKHIIWAYDELQTIGQHTMDSPETIFGTDTTGHPNVYNLTNHPKQPRQDIVLKTCYRNHPNVLAAAHTLGFGIYRKKSFVQFFDEPKFWEDIGYKVVEGNLSLGEEVVIERDKEYIPSFFNELFESEDYLISKTFKDKFEQYYFLAEEIKKNIEQELLPSDILVINANPYTTKNDLFPLKQILAEQGISSHLAGVTSSVDEFFLDDQVTLSGIYRAKGNESPMVYVVNTEYCFDGFDIDIRRNILFTAMTRSKGWVRLLGCGEDMDKLSEEVDELKRKNYQLNFTYPTQKELDKLRNIRYDLNKSEKETFDQMEKIIDQLESGEIDPKIFNQLDAKKKQKIKSLFENLDDQANS